MRKLTLHQRLTLGLQLILLIEAVLAVWQQQWLTSLIIAAILLITMAPFFVKKFLRIYIPPEFVLFVIIFVFASLFLGEIHKFYTRFWWWDIALHSCSGILLGIVGFLLVYVLNETEEIGLHMKPGFVAFFAFLFAIGIGTLWEIFEFSMDSIFGMNMQKPMLGDPSGLTDTMWDLIVDAIGALLIAVLGYSYIKTAKNESFLEHWIKAFIKNNPRLFKQ